MMKQRLVHRRRVAHSFRPLLESLEGRLLPSYTITDLGTLGGAGSIAFGISGSTIVGESDVSGNQFSHAFLYRTGMMHDLGTLGGSDSFATAVQGTYVAGTSATAGDRFSHSFLSQNGHMTDLGTLGGMFSSAWGVNLSGQVVGDSITPSGADHAFIYQNGSMTDLGTLGGSSSIAYGINNQGEAVGDSDTGHGATDAFSWKAGTFTDLGTLGGPTSAATAVNNNGVVVGYSKMATSGETYDAFLYRNGHMIDLGHLGTPKPRTSTFAMGINSGGEVVGYTTDTNGDHEAFVYNGGHLVNLNTQIAQGSGWDLEQALGVSATGQIVGYGFNPSGQFGAFLLTPAADSAASVGVDSSLGTALPAPIEIRTYSPVAGVPSRGASLGPAAFGLAPGLSGDGGAVIVSVSYEAPLVQSQSSTGSDAVIADPLTQDSISNW
jgi:probable HAF family extracellular repeat protein